MKSKTYKIVGSTPLGSHELAWNLRDNRTLICNKLRTATRIYLGSRAKIDYAKLTSTLDDCKITIYEEVGR